MKTKLCWVIIYTTAFLVVTIQSGFKGQNFKNLLQAMIKLIKGNNDTKTKIKPNSI